MHGGDFHGPDRLFEVELAYTRDGEFTHIRIDVLDDEGAYPGRSPLQLAKPIGAIVGPYRITSAEYHARAVVTNKTRSEERRVGKEGRSRWRQRHEKEKSQVNG